MKKKGRLKTRQSVASITHNRSALMVPVNIIYKLILLENFHEVAKFKFSEIDIFSFVMIRLRKYSKVEVIFCKKG